ncbi:DUF2274 domain-containing protein [Xanthobacter flavus]|uniref:DUF2274 domain-containing protein n=1 Tax=Xanthobacter flavus TaxID=281 RepID=UPI00372C6926
MPKLKLSEILDDKPVKVTVELPGKLHRDLIAYAQILSEEKGSPIADPVRLIVPMLERFMVTDRAFAKARRTMNGAEKPIVMGASFPSGSGFERG